MLELESKLMQRYSDDELLELLRSPESDCVERQENFDSSVRAKVCQAVCAFANDLPGHNRPGVLFIGATDDGRPSGCEITDDLLTSLAAIRSDGQIAPMPSMTVERRTLDGADYAVVTVLPALTPPVRFGGRIWVRVGPSRAVANEQDERVLIEKRRYHDAPYDLHPLPRGQIADLSLAAFEHEFLPTAYAGDILAANSRTVEQQLAACGMITAPKDGVPTVLGALILGKSPQDIIPGAYIQFLRLGGTSLVAGVLDEASFSGTAAAMLRGAEEKLRAHATRAVNLSAGPTHKVTMDYPFEALRQILYNAVAHRRYEGTNAPVSVHWFDDRIEVNSPGGPYGRINAGNFGTPGLTDYRNPNLALALGHLGFVERFGRGIIIAQEAMAANGNPPIDFETSPSAVVAILRKKP